MSANVTPVLPLKAVETTGAAPPSGMSSKVDAVIHSAVAEDSNRPNTATRASSTCSRPGNGPRSGANQRRQPPTRRATKAVPESDNTSIAAAPTAVAMRPPSPRNSERCRLVSQRSAWFGSAEPTPCAGFGVDDGGTRRTLIEPVGGDPARGRATDLLDARIGGLDPLGQCRDAHLRRGLRGGQPLGRRKDR